MRSCSDRVIAFGSYLGMTAAFVSCEAAIRDPLWSAESADRLDPLLYPMLLTTLEYSYCKVLLTRAHSSVMNPQLPAISGHMKLFEVRISRH